MTSQRHFQHSFIAVAVIATGCAAADSTAPTVETDVLAPPIVTFDHAAPLRMVAAPKWELSGLRWGGAPKPARGRNAVALRSTLSDALRPPKPPASSIRLRFPPGKKIGELGHMSYRYQFAQGDCGGGSPRLQVGLDLDGDGVFDGNAFGFALSPGGTTTQCGLGVWREEVATDGDASWQITKVTPGTGPAFVPWAVAVDEVTIAHPDHQVLWLLWVQDSFWLFDPLETWVDDLDLDGHFLGNPGDLRSKRKAKSAKGPRSKKSGKSAKSTKG